MQSVLLLLSKILVRWLLSIGDQLNMTHPKNAEYQRRWREKAKRQAERATELEEEIQRLKSKLAKVAVRKQSKRGK